MNKEQFIKCCSAMGYCNKEMAQKYAADRDEFTEKDFEEAWRYQENMSALISNDHRRKCGNGKTTKRYSVYNSHKG